MVTRVVGAGLPRTGTTSLKAALETLTGEPCYHMFELIPRVKEHGPLFWQALEGDPSKLDDIRAEFSNSVDWPMSLFWREELERDPDCLILMSYRATPQAWWASVDRTVWDSMRRPSDDPRWTGFAELMRAKAGFGEDWDDPAAAMARYSDLLDEVRATVPESRLVLWQPGDGWEPLCAALGCEVPDESFPRLNDTDTFRDRAGWDKPDDSQNTTNFSNTTNEV